MILRYSIYGLMLCLFFLTGCGKGSDKLTSIQIPTVTIKDVVIDKVDEADGMISVSYGKNEKPTKLINIPLAKGVRVVASHIMPGSVNNLPFRWEYVERLKGKTVSIRLHVDSTGLSIISISSGND